MVIPKENYKRLQNHLLILQEKVCSPLRDNPRRDDCPIAMFAPNKDRNGRRFVDAMLGVWYSHATRYLHDTRYLAYHNINEYLENIDWWERLTPAHKHIVVMNLTRWIRSLHANS